LNQQTTKATQVAKIAANLTYFSH